MDSFIIDIPKDRANLQLPDPELLEYYESLDDRVYFLDSEVDHTTLDLVHLIRKWNKEDRDKPVEQRQPIKILIFSPGGNLEVMRTICTVMKLSETPIWTIDMGIAYSAAAMIFLCGHHRKMLKTSTLLLHKGSCSDLSGSFDEVQAAMDEYKKQINELTGVIQENTGFTNEEIATKISSDWYISAEEALKREACDSIVESIVEIL